MDKNGGLGCLIYLGVSDSKIHLQIIVEFLNRISNYLKYNR